MLDRLSRIQETIRKPHNRNISASFQGFNLGSTGSTRDAKPLIIGLIWRGQPPEMMIIRTSARQTDLAQHTFHVEAPSNAAARRTEFFEYPAHHDHGAVVSQLMRQGTNFVQGFTVMSEAHSGVLGVPSGLPEKWSPSGKTSKPDVQF